MNEAEMKTRRENQTAAMDEKIKELADRAIEFYDMYGAEDYRYQMMVTFLDVAFQRKIRYCTRTASTNSSCRAATVRSHGSNAE